MTTTRTTKTTTRAKRTKQPVEPAAHTLSLLSSPMSSLFSFSAVFICLCSYVCGVCGCLRGVFCLCTITTCDGQPFFYAWVIVCGCW